MIPKHTFGQILNSGPLQNQTLKDRNQYQDERREKSTQLNSGFISPLASTPSAGERTLPEICNFTFNNNSYCLFYSQISFPVNISRTSTRQIISEVFSFISNSPWCVFILVQDIFVATSRSLHHLHCFLVQLPRLLQAGKRLRETRSQMEVELLLKLVWFPIPQADPC